MEGGAIGLGAIGVFLASAARHGHTSATVSAVGELNVSNLAITATTNQNITTNGFSITIGSLSGAGETQTSTLDETVSATLDGGAGANPLPTLSPSGNVKVAATSNNNVGSHNGISVPDISISYLFGVGVYQTSSTANPTVTALVQNLNLQPAGSLSINAKSSNQNQALTRSGSGGLVSGAASISKTLNAPTVSTNIGNAVITADSVTISAANTSSYDCESDSTNASLLGGSGAVANNSGTANVSANLNNGVVLTGNQLVTIGTTNDFQNSGHGQMVKSGAGGVVNGSAAIISTNLTGNSVINVATGNKIFSNLAGGILLGASQNASASESVGLTTGGAIEVTDTTGSTSFSLNAAVNIGQNAKLVAYYGPVGIGTNIQSFVSSGASCSTYGLAGNASASSSTTVTATQSVTVGAGVLIQGGQNLMLGAGNNPLNGKLTEITANSNANGQTGGILVIPSADAEADITSHADTNLASSSQLISDQDVHLYSSSGILQASGHWNTSWNGISSFGNNSGSGQKVKQSATMELNATVLAGRTHELAIEIPSSGDQISVNGQSINLQPGDDFNTQTVIAPGSGSIKPFKPFSVAYNTSYNPQSLENQVDPAAWALLQSYLSNTPVSAVQLTGLEATGGHIEVNAGTVTGSGTLTAYQPHVTITNESKNYLLLNGVNIPNSLNLGNIIFTGAANAGSVGGVALRPYADGVKTAFTNVTLTAPGAVGSGTQAGPALLVTAPIQTTDGSVNITNDYGAMVTLAPINAVSISISTPNGAYIMNTPTAYTGIGGNITSQWQSTAGPQGSPGWNVPTTFFYPGQIGTTFDANLAASTAAVYKFNSNNGQWAKTNISPSSFMENYVAGVAVHTSDTNNPNSYIYYGDAIPYLNGNGHDDNESQAKDYTNVGTNGLISGTYQIGSGNDGNGYLPLMFPNLPIYAAGSISALNGSIGKGITAAQVEINAL